METRFPEHPGYAGQFVVGMRRRAGVLERTGTAVLKRTYAIDPAAGTLAPAEEALPVFMTDRPDNVVHNGDFASPLTEGPGDDPVHWHPEGVAIQAVPDASSPPDLLLQVSGAARGRVVQTVEFDEPLGGRTFTFSFRAASVGSSARIEAVQLEADGAVICRIDANLAAVPARRAATGTWPAGLEATECRVVLRMATLAAGAVRYGAVQVEERGHATRWSPFGAPRYEHDLVAVKPHGDLVVLGMASAPGVLRARVDGAVWLTRTLPAADPPEKAAFGWERRDAGPRKADAAFPEDEDAYPLPEALPAGFQDRFYNGYLRSAVSVPRGHLPANAQIRLERDSVPVYAFRLRGDAPAATVFHHAGAGPDEEGGWSATPVPMPLDTLVVEPEAHRCYAVWRGVWPFDDRSEDAYRLLAVAAGP
jgi:hypothetical protein